MAILNFGKKKSNEVGTEKKKNALGMFGSKDYNKAVQEAFKNSNIYLFEDDIVTAADFVSLYKKRKAEFAFIYADATTGLPGGLKGVVSEVREKLPDIRIALFFDSEMIDDQFKNWAAGQKVYDLFVSDSENIFDFDIIAEALNEDLPTSVFELKELQETHAKTVGGLKQELVSTKERSEELERKLKELEEENERLYKIYEEENALDFDSSEEAKILREANRELGEKLFESKRENEALRLHLKEAEEKEDGLEKEEQGLQENRLRLEEQEKEAEKKLKEAERKFEEAEEKMRKLKELELKIETLKNVPDKEPEVRVVYKEVPVPTEIARINRTSIACFDVSAGAGATYTAYNLAKELAENGYSTGLLSLRKRDLEYAAYKKGISIDVNSNIYELKESIASSLSRNEVTIIDFGTPIFLTADGHPDLDENLLDNNTKELISEIRRCDAKIGLSFADRWHFNKLKYYEPIADHSFIFGIAGFNEQITKDKDVAREIEKLNMFVAAREKVIELLLIELGIRQRSEIEKEKRRKRNDKATI